MIPGLLVRGVKCNYLHHLGAKFINATGRILSDTLKEGEGVGLVADIVGIVEG